MNLITSKVTPDPVYMAAKEAQKSILYDIGMSRDPVGLQSIAYDFEDAMNGMSGALQNIDATLLRLTKEINSEIVSRGTIAGVTIRLHESVLPSRDSISNVVVEVMMTGKKLYPLTTTGMMNVSNITYTPSTSITISGLANGGSVSTDTVLYDPSISSSFTEDYDTVDPIFDELDADAEGADDWANTTPMSLEQNETIKQLPEDMVSLAAEAASNVSGLQAGLVAFSQNPIASTINDTKSLLLYYTQSNYANLNTALAVIHSDGALATEYKALKESIGGGDGLSGGVAQMDIFKDHTDRLSGLVLAEDSPNAEATGDSTDEFLNVNDISGNLQPLFSFDAKKFRSAKYMVQCSAANTERGHQATELYILHDNEFAYTREIVSIYTQDPFVTFTTQFLSGNVRVLANTSAPNTDFVIHGTKLRIARVAESFADMSQQKLFGLQETLQAFLDDGIDYTANCCTSILYGEGAVARLARDFRDMLVVVGNASGSTPEKQALLTQWTNTIKSRRQEIQDMIDQDYAQFRATQRLAESLGIAQGLCVGYSEAAGNVIARATLNSAATAAIESELP